jgi:hypothetical protein
VHNKIVHNSCTITHIDRTHIYDLTYISLTNMSSCARVVYNIIMQGHFLIYNEFFFCFYFEK